MRSKILTTFYCVVLVSIYTTQWNASSPLGRERCVVR
jgi:hypothetical protein